MENGQLFTVKGSQHTFRVVVKEKSDCEGCYAFGNNRLCAKMPYCGGNPRMVFEKVSAYELRKAKKENKQVEHFEN